MHEFEQDVFRGLHKARNAIPAKIAPSSTIKITITVRFIIYAILLFRKRASSPTVFTPARPSASNSMPNSCWMS